ncbi:MAG: nitroreductase family protein, partial [Dehalococcoidales bacterium]|nr:nitroreductase family protein [Dehalococcoidales bacterium]
MEVFEAIKTRRSIRHYKSEAIAEEKLNAVLEAARWAPSWANTQCWRFIVVRNNDTKARLADTLTSWNPAHEAIKEAPIVIVACAEMGKSGFFQDAPITDKGDWCMFDVALAMQNLALAAHSLGLGTVHVGAFDAQKVAQ